jgi:hypothetical protein
MANSRIQLIADQVVTTINANVAAFGTWGTAAANIAAARVYTIKKDLTDAPDVTGVPLVIVAMGDKKREPANRAICRFDLAVHIAIQQKVNPLVNAQVDPVLGLAEQLDDFWIAPANRVVAVPGLGNVEIQSTDTLALYVPEHMDQFKVCTSVLQLNFVLVA